MALGRRVAALPAALAVVQRCRAETAFDAARNGAAVDAVAPLALRFGLPAAADDATDDGDERHDDGEDARHDHADHRTWGKGEGGRMRSFF